MPTTRNIETASLRAFSTCFEHIANMFEMTCIIWVLICVSCDLVWIMVYLSHITALSFEITTFCERPANFTCSHGVRPQFSLNVIVMSL